MTIALRLENVQDVAVIGQIGVIRATVDNVQRIFITRIDWYPKYSIDMVRRLLRAGWLRGEVAREFGVHHQVIVDAVAGDPDVPRRAKRGSGNRKGRPSRAQVRS
jgi:hypothetical protein